MPAAVNAMKAQHRENIISNKDYRLINFVLINHLIPITPAFSENFLCLSLFYDAPKCSLQYRYAVEKMYTSNF